WSGSSPSPILDEKPPVTPAARVGARAWHEPCCSPGNQLTGELFMSFSPPVRSCSSMSVMSVMSVALALSTSCGPGAAAPDGAPPWTIPPSPAGVFAITSTLDIPVPAMADPVIAGLTAATDGPDDPTRYLIDRMIATLPDGTIKTIAT